MRNATVSLLLLLVGCGESAHSPQDELRDWVDLSEAAVEEEDRSGFLELISENYTDTRGNDRNRIGDVLRVYFLRQDSIALLTSIDEIELSGETAATIDLTVGMAGTRNSALGFSADAYRFELELVKPEDEWLLIGAKWGEIGRELR